MAADPAVVAAVQEAPALLVNCSAAQQRGCRIAVVDGQQMMEDRIFAKRNLTRLNVQQTARVLVKAFVLPAMF